MAWVNTAYIELTISDMFEQHGIDDAEHLYDIYDEISRCLNYEYEKRLAEFYENEEIQND
jgi:hypothetical protein